MKLPLWIADRLRVVAELEAPEEAIALVLVAGDVAIAHVPLPNRHPAPETGFELGLEHLALWRTLAAAGLDEVVLFHSHPSGPATPSKRDLRHATIGERLLVYALERGELELARVEAIHDERSYLSRRAVPESLELVEDVRTLPDA